jgi:nitrate reductase gamma subunit
LFLLIFIYFSVIAFIGFSLYKGYQFARMPLQSRLDLYPVPKEAGEKGEYGGSYFEELEWWKKSRQVSMAGEIKEMLKEMLFIKKLFVNQRRLWWISYSLHLGIYLLFLGTVFLLVGAVTELAGLPVTAGAGVNAHWWAVLVYYGAIAPGFAGALLASFGSAGLFLRRVFDKTMSKYTTLQEYFNLLFIFGVLVSGVFAWSITDPALNYGRDIVKGLLTFSPIQAGTAMTVHIVLLGLLLIYIPQTKMSHYVGKYFSFHKVLWENEPNLRNSKMEAKIKKALSYKPKTSWSAPHIKPAGSGVAEPKEVK